MTPKNRNPSKPQLRSPRPAASARAAQLSARGDSLGWRGSCRPPVGPWARQLALLCGPICCAAPAAGQGLRIGSLEPQPAAPNDAALPTGPLRKWAARPAAPHRSHCSREVPVCVHGAPSADAELAAYLQGMASAYRVWVEGARLPAPMSDVDLGPTPGLDLYVGMQGPWLRTELDPSLDSKSASLHCLARKSSEAKHQAAACVAEAILARVAGSEGPGVREALGLAMTHRLLGYSATQWGALGDYQANPHRSPLRRTRSRDSSGASAFWGYAVAQLGLAHVGELAVALGALSPSKPQLGSRRWNNRPDSLDALRWALGNRPEHEGAFLLALATARASRGVELRSSAKAVRFDWRVAASSLPRNLAARRPLEPYGATFLWLDLDVGLPAPLLLRCEWEGPVGMRWAALVVDAQGRAARRLDLTFVAGAHSAQRVLEQLDGARAVAIIGVNLGAVDAAHPFDPDHEPWEAHGFTVLLAPLDEKELDGRAAREAGRE